MQQKSTKMADRKNASVIILFFVLHGQTRVASDRQWEVLNYF